MKKYIYKIGKIVLNENMKRKFRGGGIKRMLNIPTKKIDIGFIGTGRHAFQNIYPSLRYAPINLKAVCAKSLEEAREARIFGAEHFYDNYKEMFEKEKLDAVFIAVSRKMHKQICIDAMNAGLHVFVEKAPADNLEEVEESIETNKKTGKILMVGFQKRFAPGYVKIKEKIDNGLKFDTVKLFFRVGKYKNVVELIKEVGIHHIDIIGFLFGEAKKVFIINKDEDSILFSLELGDNRKAELYFSGIEGWDKPSEDINFYYEGKEVLSLHNVINLYSKKTLIWEPNISIPIDENQTFFLNGFAYEIRHFVECVFGKTHCKSSIEESLNTYRIIEKILE